MSEPRKTMKPILKEAGQTLPELKTDIQNDPKTLTTNALRPEEHYLKRQMDVTQQDHEEFLKYLEEKRAREEEKRARKSAPEQLLSAQAEKAEMAPSKLNRRSFLTVVAGTAAVGEAAALGHMVINDQAIPSHGLKHAGDTYTEAQRHNIERELINPKADIGGRGFGNSGPFDADQTWWRHLCRSTSTRAGRSPGSATGRMVIITRFRITFAPSRAQTRCRASNGSTAPRAARMPSFSVSPRTSKHRRNFCTCRDKGGCLWLMTSRTAQSRFDFGGF